MMSSASLTQTKGWQRWFQASQKRPMAATRSATLGKLPRRIAWRVMIAKNTSTRFIQLADQVHPARRGRGAVQLHPRMPGQPGLDRGMGMGAVVVQHQVELPPRVGLGHQLEEGE